MSPYRHLREALPSDQAWLAALYAEVRHDEVASFGWDAASAGRFLAQQFAAQQAGYRAAWPQSRCMIVEQGEGTDPSVDFRIGRFWVDRSAGVSRVLDISLLRAWRGRGIGTQVLRSFLDEADRSEQPVLLQVADGNPARRLYERCGFEVDQRVPPYLLMHRRPAVVRPFGQVEVCDGQT